MSFVPLTGPATLRAGRGAARRRRSSSPTTAATITLPIRAALPVLAKARTADDAHPSVALLAAASLLGDAVRRRRQVRARATAGWRLSAARRRTTPSASGGWPSRAPTPG